MISVGLPLTIFFFLLFNLMPVLTCAARKMFPKRKLDESRSSSESQKEEAREEQGQQHKRPRVESSASTAGTPSPRSLITVQLLKRESRGEI